MPRLAPLLVGAVVAPLANLGIFSLARALGGFGSYVIATAAGAPITATPVIASSVAAVVGAALTRGAFAIVMRRSTARWAFLGVSAVFLLASFTTPLVGLSGAGLLEIAALEGMHIVAALAAVVAVEVAFRPTWDWGVRPWTSRAPEPRNAFVSGATSGIGAEVALQLAARGFRVVGVGRSAEKARAVEARAAGLPGSLRVLPADLSLVRACDSVATEAARLAPEGYAVVVHCVGTLLPTSAATDEGVDANFATSYLARVALTEGLPCAPAARIVNVAAAENGDLPSAMRVPLGEEADIGSGMLAHGRAQLANDLWVAGLARAGRSAWGYGPGAVETGIRRELPAAARALIGPLFRTVTRTASEAAADVLRLALEAELPRSGFASRDGTFAHHAFVLDAARQDALAGLTRTLLAKARAARPSTARGA